MCSIHHQVTPREILSVVVGLSARDTFSEENKHHSYDMNSTRRTSLTWTLFLIFLFTTQIPDTEAVALKLKKLLKKALLIRALTPKKNIAIIPIPIPLNLLLKLLKSDEMKMPEEMPMPMPMPPYPMYMPMGEMMMPKEKEMPPPMKYGMM